MITGGKTQRGLKRMSISGFVLTLLFILSCRDDNSHAVTEPAKETDWTVMYYGDADCNLESAIIADIAEMKNGFVDGQGINLILLVDRIKGYSVDSSVLGVNFTDTRLFRITNNTAWRIDGSAQFPEITGSSTYEANMGDGATLKKFIQFCKANYPASRYSLILSNHGGGAMKKNVIPVSASYREVPDVADLQIRANICQDDTSNYDILYTAEISDILTSAESVDLFALDACLMSSAEFAYQFRNDSSNSGFRAGFMVASAPNELIGGFDYEAIFQRLQNKSGDNGTSDGTLGGNELYYDPSTLTAQQLGAVIVEEQRDSMSNDPSQSLTCIDLSKIKAVKEAVDVLSVKLSSVTDAKTDLEALRGMPGDLSGNIMLHYFDETYYDTELQAYTEWIYSPYFDIYNLSAAVNQSSGFSSDIQNAAAILRDAVGELVLYSFANSDFSGFVANKSGVHIFFPAGDYQYTSSKYETLVDSWFLQDWYNALDVSGKYTGAPLGKLSWCADGATAGNTVVENWFELLDSWYDGQSIGSSCDGNFNYYSY